MWARSLSQVTLILPRSELLLEPVDHVLEGVVVLVMEEVASRLDFDELFYHFSARQVDQDHVLRILVQDRESVRDLVLVLCLLSFHYLLDFLQILALLELRVLDHFT